VVSLPIIATRQLGAKNKTKVTRGDKSQRPLDVSRRSSALKEASNVSKSNHCPPLVYSVQPNFLQIFFNDLVGSSTVLQTLIIKK